MVKIFVLVRNGGVIYRST